MRGWSISRAPLLSIGSENGPQTSQFSRIGGAVRLADGRIVVGNGASAQLRFFDSTGAFLMAKGRRGQGPEEFGEISSLRIWLTPGGELLVNDSGNDRLNVFDQSPLLRTLKLAPAPAGPRVFLVNVFSDGTLLASAQAGGGRLNAEVVGPLAPITFSYLRYSPTGEFQRELLSAAERPRYVNEYGTTRHFPYIPATAAPVLAAHDETVVVYGGLRARDRGMGCVR